MPILPHQVTPIETFLPPVDHRNAGRSFVVDGRNFLFGPKGPYSGFTTRMLTPFPFGAPAKSQGMIIQNRPLVFTSDAILTWRNRVPFTWELLYGFQTGIAAELEGPWCGMYIDDQLWLSQPGRGMFSTPLDPGSNKMWLEPRSSFNIPGLISQVRGMDVVHSRGVLVNDDVIQWSGVGDMSDLTPALGGAGFQDIDAFVQGTFLGLNSFQDGFVVWTTGGSVIGEYIGGDEVWEFYPLKTQLRPVGRRAVARLEDGNIVFLTRQGLMISNNSANIEPFSAAFNEYFLTTMFPEDGQLTPNQFWRLDYNPARETIYLSESADGISYFRTFVFNPTRDKWGLFSERHYGLLPLTLDTYGYVDINGYPHYFVPSFSRESEPANARGLNRIMPRLEKQGLVMSSSVVCRTAEWIDESTMDPYDPPAAGWYDGPSEVPTQGDPIGLNSWVEVGYVKPDQLTGWVNQTVEIQEIKISSPPSAPNFPNDFRTNHHADWFYPTFEDWDSAPMITMYDIVDDWMLGTESEDWLLLPDQTEDCMLVSYSDVQFTNDGFEDWNSMPDSSEDWDGPGSGLNPHPYGLELRASQDGITFDSVIPSMARFNTTAQDWSGISSGLFHRIRVSAMNVGEYYDLTHVAVTLQFSGNLG